MEEILLTGTISKINTLSPRVLEFSLSTDKPLKFIPGQFITIHNNGIERSYSISNTPGENHIELIVSLNNEGKLTPDLFEKKVGDTLQISEAKGTFILPEFIENGICFICTGTGIGPFKSMIDSLLKTQSSPPEIHLVFGNRTHVLAC